MADAVLNALADVQLDARYGRMLVKTAGRWSFPGCPLDGVNLRVPRYNAPDSQVLAAIADGSWSAFEVDQDGKPTKAVEASSPFFGRPTLQPHEAGGARAVPPMACRADVYRGSPLTPAFGQNASTFDGLWIGAWRAGVVPGPSGAGIGAQHLVLRLNMGGASIPLVGDRLSVEGAQYTVKAVASAGTNSYDLVLSRYIHSGMTG